MPAEARPRKLTPAPDLFLPRASSRLAAAVAAAAMKLCGCSSLVGQSVGQPVSLGIFGVSSSPHLPKRLGPLSRSSKGRQAVAGLYFNSPCTP